MSWPLSQDYNEAIQDPGNSFGDAELKTGEAVANALGIPMLRSRQFRQEADLERTRTNLPDGNSTDPQSSPAIVWHFVATQRGPLAQCPSPR